MITVSYDGEDAAKMSELLGAPYQEVEKMSQISDGYHTFEELYRYRMLLQAAWLNELHAQYLDHDTEVGAIIKSWRHADGELCFGKDNYFIVIAQLPTGQISNHYKGEFWDLFKVAEAGTAPEWDGHTPAEAADRIEKYLRGDYQNEN